MSFVEWLVKWVPFWGTVVAGFAGAYYLYLRWRDERERLLVGLGPVTADINPYQQMHVINIGARKVILGDFGFVLDDGRLFSALEESQLEPQAWGGSFKTQLGQNDFCCPGCEGYRGLHIVGAYAKTATRRRTHIYLDPHQRLLTRLRLVLKLKLFGGR